MKKYKNPSQFRNDTGHNGEESVNHQGEQRTVDTASQMRALVLGP